VTPNRPGRPSAQHRLERIAERVAERFWRRVDLAVESMTINGRAAFLQQLTDDELLARFRDPLLQQEMMADVERREGASGAGKLLDRVYEASLRQEKKIVER